MQAVRGTLAEASAFSLALSGGGTPRALYALLAIPPFRAAADWSRVHFFWGDERYVPHDHPASNFRLAYEIWLQHLDLPAGNLHPMPTDDPDPEQAARRYEQTLRECGSMGVGGYGSEKQYGSMEVWKEGRVEEWKSGGQYEKRKTKNARPQTANCKLQTANLKPQFDLILLGMGEDGHTASLFPGSPALEEQVGWVVPAEAPFEPRQRLTLTLPVLNAARRVWFLVSGGSKAEVLKRVLKPAPDEPLLPAALIRPTAGELLWWLDRAASWWLGGDG